MFIHYLVDKLVNHKFQLLSETNGENSQIHFRTLFAKEIAFLPIYFAYLWQLRA